jgi:hypothetical protein
MPTNTQKPSSFGKSLRLSEGDLVFEGREEEENGFPVVKQDLAVLAGRDNFLQGMQVMIETPLGSDILNVNYGFDILGHSLHATDCRIHQIFDSVEHRQERESR